MTENIPETNKANVRKSAMRPTLTRCQLSKETETNANPLMTHATTYPVTIAIVRDTDGT